MFLLLVVNETCYWCVTVLSCEHHVIVRFSLHCDNTSELVVPTTVYIFLWCNISYRWYLSSQIFSLKHVFTSEVA